MKLHPRHDLTVQAHLDISNAVAAAAEKHGLTYAELVAILAVELASWTKFQIRAERVEEASMQSREEHGDDTDAPTGSSGS